MDFKKYLTFRFAIAAVAVGGKLATGGMLYKAFEAEKAADTQGPTVDVAGKRAERDKWGMLANLPATVGGTACGLLLADAICRRKSGIPLLD